MAGKGTPDLLLPPRRYDPRGRAGFETLADSRKEDRTRARLLRRTARSHPRLAVAMQALADRLDPALARRPRTRASSRWTRRHRRRLAGALHQLYDEAGGRAARADVLPANQIVRAEDLPDPRRLVATFGQAIRRAGGRPGTGWLYAALHGEFDVETGNIHLHWHILASGSCLAAVDGKLREHRAFSHDRAVRVSRQPLTNLPRALTYVLQGWWPARYRGVENSRRGRMPDLAHSLWLLWLDRYPPNAAELMIGLRVIEGRLVPR